MIRKIKNYNFVREAKKSYNTTFRLGETLDLLLSNMIEPQQKHFEVISNLWCKLMPAELFRHTKIDDISDGQLKVIVDSPSFMYEMRLCSTKILTEIKHRCPQARIQKIKLSIG